MIKEGKFGTQEAVSLVVITIVNKLFYTSPSLLAKVVGTTGWYLTLISAGTAMVGFTFIYLLLKRFPGQNLPEIFESVFWAPIGFILSALLAIFLLVSTAIGVREFTDVLKIYTLPLSPPSFILGILVSGILVLNLLGLESMARFARLSALALLLTFFSVLLLGAQNYDSHNIHPLFGYGLGRTILQGLSGSSQYGEVILLAIFAGSLQGVNYLKKAGYISIAISGLLISTGLLAFTLTFPYYTAPEITAPMYQMATLIDFGRFLQRIDPLFLFVWIISAFISRSLLFYGFASLYCKIFRIQDTRPVIISSSIILFTLALIPQDMISLVLFYFQIIRNYGWIIFYLLPFTALIIAGLKKQGGVGDA